MRVCIKEALLAGRIYGSRIKRDTKSIRGCLQLVPALGLFWTMLPQRVHGSEGIFFLVFGVLWRGGGFLWLFCLVSDAVQLCVEVVCLYKERGKENF